MYNRQEKEPATKDLNNAAKDLYDALKEIVDTEWIGGNGGLVRARKALAKAQGDQG